MINRWLLPDYVDRRLPLTRRDLADVRRKAWRRWFADRRNIMLYVIAVLVLATVGEIAMRLIRARIGDPTALQWTAMGAGYVVLLFIGLSLLQWWRFRPLVRRIVREQGFDVCERCGRWRKPGEMDGPVERCKKKGCPMKERG